MNCTLSNQITKYSNNFLKNNMFIVKLVYEFNGFDYGMKPMITIIDLNTNFVCEFCNQQLLDSLQLIKHIQLRHYETFCSINDVLSSRQTNSFLKQTKRTKSHKKKKFQCRFCPRSCTV